MKLHTKRVLINLKFASAFVQRVNNDRAFINSRITVLLMKTPSGAQSRCRVNNLFK